MAEQGADRGSSTGSRDDADAFARNMREVAERSQQIIRDFLSRNEGLDTSAPADPLNLTTAFTHLTERMMENPARLVEAQAALWQDYLNLWQSTASRMAGGEAKPVIAPEPSDKRFKDKDWSENQLFDFIKQSYLLTARWILNTVHGVQGMDPDEARKIDFYTRQFVDAMAPSNFVTTNPEVLRATIESKGENLVRGLNNMIRDMEKGGGELRISMTDEKAFELGRNVATAPGKVVFQNGLMQILQYTPTTETVHKRPLLIVPPWINKFYILDLQPKNSFIRFAVEQGHTVFVVSWVNPDEEMAKKTFEDYMVEGLITALDKVTEESGVAEVNVIGYCIGGTLLATTLSYLKAQGDKRVKSATFFTTLTDFRDAGDIKVFVDEAQIGNLEKVMSKKGYLEGRKMATAFNMLRSNDLIWSFVVNNYLLGKDPFPFDLLYWNSDATRMPAAMHSFYLRHMYRENKLVEPGGITMRGVPIDLRQIDIPVYILSAQQDHIAPWKSTYRATQLYSGNTRFVLGASGHIAGVINPPAANKYDYWTNKDLPADPEAWFAGAEKHAGSWWVDWAKWIKRLGGAQVPARTPGEVLGVIEDAPGSYVKMRD